MFQFYMDFNAFLFYFKYKEEFVEALGLALAVTCKIQYFILNIVLRIVSF